MPFAGSFNVQASFGGITEDNIDSGAAAAGEVLTADGSGGAGWQAAGGGGAGVTSVPFLGNVGHPDTWATYGEIWAAYEAVTGQPLTDGTIVALVNNGGPEFQVLVFWHEQRLMYLLNSQAGMS